MAWDFGTVRHIHLRNLFIHDVNGSWCRKIEGRGTALPGKTGARSRKPFRRLVIEACHLLRTDRNGICGYSEHSERNNWFPSLHVVIRNNLLEDIGGDGIKVWGCENALVEYNRLTKGRQRCDDYAAGIWPWSSDGTIIQFNEVSGMKGTRDGQAFDSDGNCRGTLFQYNYSHDNAGGFMLICGDGDWKLPTMLPNTGTVIRYNISQNDGARTFHLSGPIRDTRIYNNVFSIRRASRFLCFCSPTGMDRRMESTLPITFSSRKGVPATAMASAATRMELTRCGRIRLEQKVPSSKATSTMAATRVRPKDPKAVWADPLFVKPGSGGLGLSSLEGYKLKDGSPCLRAGVRSRTMVIATSGEILCPKEKILRSARRKGSRRRK